MTGEADYVELEESVLVLTEDEWEILAGICRDWLNGSTTVWHDADDAAAADTLAQRIIEVSDG